MKVINCFILSIFFLIAGCGNIQWFPSGDNSGSPSLTMALSTATAQIGNPVTLTFTITNATGNPAQSNLTFTDTFSNITNNNGQYPVFVANPSNVTTTCGGAIFTGNGATNIAVSPGDQSFTFSGGALTAGTTSCTVSIDFTSNATTDSQPFTNGSGNVSSNLNLNNLTVQSLVFTPFPSSTNVNLSAKNLLVTMTGTTAQISLYVINSGNTTVPATVTVEGFDTSNPPASVITVPIIINSVSTGNVNGQLVTQSVANVPTGVKTWEITAIN